MLRCLLLLPLLCAHSAHADLVALVDLEDPAERLKAARRLARRKDLDTAGLLEAMRGFRPRTTPSAGDTVRVVALRVRERVEETEITTYVPEGYDAAKPAPLLLALHGSGGDGRFEHSRWRDAADRLGMVVVAPTEAGANEGYRFSRRERAAALAVLRWTRRAFNVDENRIHVTGISRGGHLSWDLGLRYPDRFASLAPMVGGPRFEIREGQNNLRYLENLVRMPIRDLQGEQDHPILLFNLRLAFEELEKLGSTKASLVTFPGLGHSFDLDAVDWIAFLGRARRNPVPARVVRRASQLRESRAHWVEILRLKRDVREVFVPKFPAAQWNALDDAGRRRLLVAEAERRTARIEARMTAPGVFVVESRGVRGFRLLLAEGMFDPKVPVQVTWNGRARRKRAFLSRQVLLEEFAERFDRTFLPVATITIP